MGTGTAWKCNLNARLMGGMNAAAAAGALLGTNCYEASGEVPVYDVEKRVRTSCEICSRELSSFPPFHLLFYNITIVQWQYRA